MKPMMILQFQLEGREFTTEELTLIKAHADELCRKLKSIAYTRYDMYCGEEIY